MKTNENQLSEVGVADPDDHLHRGQFNFPSPPELLFKYQSPNFNSLASLAESYIWLSAANELNDPHEQYALIDEEISDDDVVSWAKRLYEKNQYFALGGPNGKENYSKIINREGTWIEETRNWWIRSIKQNISGREALNYKYFCASESGKSSAMWAHYAGNHEGWALAFCPKKLVYEVDNLWVPVAYEESIPKVSIQDLFENNRFPTLVYTTKSQEWKYEKEWRLWQKQEYNRYKIEASAIKYIVFGKNAKDSTKMLVRRITSDWGLKYYDAVPSALSYQMDFIDSI